MVGTETCRPRRTFVFACEVHNTHTANAQVSGQNSIEGLRERTTYLDIFLFPPITQRCSISDVLFTGERAMSDFSVLKYY